MTFPATLAQESLKQNVSHVNPAEFFLKVVVAISLVNLVLGLQVKSALLAERD